MAIERIILAAAGIAILLSLGLAYSVSPYWLWFTAFVGFNLLQSAFTGFCPWPSSSKSSDAAPEMPSESGAMHATTPAQPP